MATPKTRPIQSELEHLEPSHLDNQAKTGIYIRVHFDVYSTAIALLRLSPTWLAEAQNAARQFDSMGPYRNPTLWRERHAEVDAMRELTAIVSQARQRVDSLLDEHPDLRRLLEKQNEILHGLDRS